MSTELTKMQPTAEAIARLLHPYAEVVIHDLTQNKVAAIFNNYSNRQVGDDSLLSNDETFDMDVSILGPYEKINWNGKRLKSITSVIRDDKGLAVGLLCINLDVSMLDEFKTLIQAFIGKEQLLPQPQVLFKEEWRERINQFIHQYSQQNNWHTPALTADQKKHLVERLHQEGAFAGKNAATYIAQVLKISRATVYNYLNEKNL